ncbi:MAG: DNA gyrase inhibitor YacG [Roseiarcus sp.]
MAEAARQPAADDRGAKAQTVCVVCGRPRDPRYDPFCSRRCADVDLYRWLKGGYVIPGSEPSRSERDDDA